MPAYLISGPSGAGKTTVGGYLASRGYSVIETDSEPGLSGYYHRISGVKATTKPEYPHPQEWLDSYVWNWDATVMKRLFEENKNKTIFFCGGAHNEKDFFDWVDVRFALATDNQDIIKRLQEREPLRWLNDSPELNNMIDWNNRFKDYSKRVGAKLIDSSQIPEKVADDIINHVNRQQALL